MKKVSFYCAIVFLSGCCVFAFLAYLIIPDQSRFANNQIPEFALMNPGQTYCLNKQLITQSDQGFVDRFLSGNRSVYKNQVVAFKQNKQTICSCFWFGTDKFGRDVLSRIVVGLRYTLIIGFASVVLSLIIGLVLGGLAGFFGGRTDAFISILINVFWSLPTILLAFAIILSFGRSFSSIFIAIALTMWGDVARLVRAQVLYYKEMLFVQASKAMGFSEFRILFKHIIPNLMGPVWVSAAGNFALAVLLESGLSFLGFGLQPPIPSLGNILQEQYSYAISGKPLLALIPSIVVVLLILSFQVITAHLRDLTDVRMQEIR
ncbi:MAG: ABC transporter permease [Saprospiraceae bacterium]|nr:ABC transporter permease [Saprospiraceae bacterium]